MLPAPVKRGPGDKPDHHALGRSRGGLTTKTHLAADSRCRPLAFVPTPGQQVTHPRSPRSRPACRYLDRSVDPEPPGRGGRPPTFGRDAYKQRDTVERCVNRLKQWHGLATRYDKTAAIYLAGLHVAAISSGQKGDPKSNGLVAGRAV